MYTDAQEIVFHIISFHSRGTGSPFDIIFICSKGRVSARLRRNGSTLPNIEITLIRNDNTIITAIVLPGLTKNAPNIAVTAATDHNETIVSREDCRNRNASEEDE